MLGTSLRAADFDAATGLVLAALTVDSFREVNDDDAVPYRKAAEKIKLDRGSDKGQDSEDEQKH